MSSLIQPERSFRIVVLSGPSGSGKTTIVHRLIESSPVPLRSSVSATTRPPRQGEIDGRDYHFLSAEEFEAKRRAGEFLECAEVHARGDWYGTLTSEIEKARRAGAWPLLEIDVQGAMSVLDEYPQAITIFLKTPADEYERRLRERGTEPEEVIRRRLETARKELALSDRYGHVVINDDIDRCVQDICQILAGYAGKKNDG